MANADERSALDFYEPVACACRPTHILRTCELFFQYATYIVVIMMPFSTWEIQSLTTAHVPHLICDIGLIYIASSLIGEKKKDTASRNGMKKQSSPAGTARLSLLIAR